jgi:hypothetical protein
MNAEQLLVRFSAQRRDLLGSVDALPIPDAAKADFRKIVERIHSKQDMDAAERVLTGTATFANGDVPPVPGDLGGAKTTISASDARDALSQLADQLMARQPSLSRAEALHRVIAQRPDLAAAAMQS